MKKPNLKFLQSVADRQVVKSCSWSRKSGTKQRVRGGEATLKAHVAAGYVRPLGVASLGRPVYAELTDAGREALTLIRSE